MKSYIYKGKVFKNCGPSSAQKSALAEDQEFGSQLRQSYSSDFAESEGLFNELHGNLSQIVEQGPGQQGFSPEELAAKNSQAVNDAAATNKNVQAMLGEKAGVANTADPGVESGVQEAVSAGAATKVANNLANEEASIQEQNYAQGTKDYEEAVAQEEGLPSAVIDPVTGVAKAAIGADETTDSQANANEQASTSWEGLAGGIIGGAAKGLVSGLGSKSAGSPPNLQVPVGFDPSAGDYLNQD